jgi:hypothetical protein
VPAYFLPLIEGNKKWTVAAARLRLGTHIRRSVTYTHTRTHTHSTPNTDFELTITDTVTLQVFEVR